MKKFCYAKLSDDFLFLYKSALSELALPVSKVCDSTVVLLLANLLIAAFQSIVLQVKIFIKM
uniref:Uncharacterized protein n=1 Tax=Tolypothrix bouteillei VB521301 TaxID=1479485 RepID=A0A0C1NL44_9CYAN